MAGEKRNILGVLEDLAEWLEVAAVEGELEDLVLQVDVAAKDVPGPPAGQLARLTLGHGMVPHQLPASVHIIICISAG